MARVKTYEKKKKKERKGKHGSSPPPWRQVNIESFYAIFRVSGCVMMRQAQ